MGIAYLITAYKYPEQLGRLVRRIEREAPGAPIFVHVDAKVEQSPFLVACRGTGAQFTTRRQVVRWGAFSMVRATLTLGEEALGSDATHVVLLSEQCYPIRPVAELEAHMGSSPGRDFVDARQVRTQWPAAAGRFERFYFPDCPPRLARLCMATRRALARIGPVRRVPDGYDVYAGSTWWALSREGLEYVLATHRGNRRLRWFFALTSVPEEMYVHTILSNSPRQDGIRPTITYARFDSRVSTEHPRAWRIDDVAELEKSGAYIARKFDASVDSAVLDYFDRMAPPA